MMIMMSTKETRLKKKHKCQTWNVRAEVDDKPPRLDISVLYNSRNLVSDVMRVRELDRENLELLQRLNTISRESAPVGCWNLGINYKSNIGNEEPAKKKILKDNKNLLHRLRTTVSEYPRKIFLQQWKDMQLQLQCARKLPEERTKLVKEDTDICMIDKAAVLNRMNPSIRKKCFFEISILDTKQIFGKMVFLLYTDIVPKTCANFEAFCRGTSGLSYKNTPFHRIVAGYWCQGGDVTTFNGVGGTSIYGDSFENENFDLRHGMAGVLSMCNVEENSVSSKFNLTFRRLETMDGRKTVFGKIIAGFVTLRKIESFGTKSGKPKKSIIISNCGVV